MKKHHNSFLNKLITFLFIAISTVTCVCYFAVKSVTAGALDVCIVLDPGHGGVDGGVIGVNSRVYEREINLSIAKLVAKNLNKAGAKVVLTRENQYGLYGVAEKNFKQRDFQKRKEIIEKNQPVVVVSIHCNKYSSPSRRGAQVFFNGANSESRGFANLMQNILNDNINTNYAKRSFDCISGDYYIVKCTDIPSIIVECGFLSNPEDDRLLNDPSFQELMSYHIFSGIMQYVGAQFLTT